jgi:hypothetical protein
MSRALICLGLLLALGSAPEEKSVLIIVKNVPDDFFEGIEPVPRPHPVPPPNTLTVIGLFSDPAFEVDSIRNVVLFDAAGRKIPLRVESASIYREFDDEGINSMRIAFEIHKDAWEIGPPKMVWGPDVSAENVEVEKIIIDPARKDRYRTFAWEAISTGDSGAQVASLEVIVDDRADVYYLWYLLPIVLIFGLLILRKVM